MAADRRCLDGAARVERLLHGHALVHSAQRVPALEPSKLCRRVLVQELVDRQVPSTDLYLDFVPFYLYHDALRAELIYAF